MPAKTRYVFFSLLGITLLGGSVLSRGIAWLMGQRGMVDATQLGLAELSTSRLVGFALAAVLAIAIYRISASRVWLTEVVDELTRVSWPSREETGHATVVVVVCVVVSALFLGLFDAAWLWLSSTVMGISGT